jgi:ubiquinone/menaquinone biosynthesis C-methylase UbiE
LAGWEAHGIELSDAYVEFAKREFGTVLLNCGIEDAPFPENYFDYINFWHVIEHLRDPGAALRTIYRWLKVGGILNLGTPNGIPLLAHIMSWYHGYVELGDGHTYVFPPKVLRAYVKSIGFEVVLHRQYNSKTSNVRRTRRFIQSIFPIYRTMQSIVARKTR